jgi:hypothetical protein
MYHYTFVYLLRRLFSDTHMNLGHDLHTSTMKSENSADKIQAKLRRVSISVPNLKSSQLSSTPVDPQLPTLASVVTQGRQIKSVASQNGEHKIDSV